jgi:hypothetical protein
MTEEFATAEGEDCGRDLQDFALQLRECGLVK